MLGNVPKFKYHSSKFKSELAKAKTYKRTMTPVSENKFRQFLQKQGLTTWKIKVAAFVFVGLLVYLLFFPNLFTIKTVTLTGLDPVKTNEIQEILSVYLNSNKFFKKNNLIFLSKNNLKSFLEKQNEVLSINQIKKTFPNKLVIEVKARTEKYLLTCEDKILIYSNDGKFQRIADSNSNTNNLVKLSIKSSCQNFDYVIDKPRISVFEILPTGIFEAIKTKVSYFEFTPKSDPDIKVVLENSSSLLIDSNTFNQSLLNNLKTLYNNLNDEEKKKVLYIDLRILNKAFVCFKGNSCTEQTIIKPLNSPETATSTTSSIIKPELSQ